MFIAIDDTNKQYATTIVLFFLHWTDIHNLIFAFYILKIIILKKQIVVKIIWKNKCIEHTLSVAMSMDATIWIPAKVINVGINLQS
jgi:hypothetical protein